jgi:hypothetical protein
MHQLSFRRVPVPDSPCELVEFWIDNRKFLDLLREHEEPFAIREGHPEIAGSYGPIPVAWLASSPGTLFGRSSPDEDVDDGRVPLLSCECGDSGCWPLLCRIMDDGHTIVWSDFQQPHRASGAGEWSYAGFGPFVFDRKLYVDAIESLVDARPAEPSQH